MDRECDDCGGLGALLSEGFLGPIKIACIRCEGTGHVPELPTEGSDVRVPDEAVEFMRDRDVILPETARSK